VSNISKKISALVDKYHSRKLKDKYKYLIFDGVYIKAKSLQKSRSNGITLDDKKELIDFGLASHGESENAWTKFIGKLYHRGLTGKNLRLVVIDGNKGLKNALEFIYPFAEIQRCWVHKMRNAGKKLPKKYHDECMSNARQIYYSKTRQQALQKFKAWARKWRELVSKAVKCIEDDYENLTSFLREPEEYHVKIRTTNAIERLFREVRRRTRTMNCFENRASVERIIFSVFNRFNAKWENGAHLEITQLT